MVWVVAQYGSISPITVLLTPVLCNITEAIQSNTNAFPHGSDLTLISQTAAVEYIFNGLAPHSPNMNPMRAPLEQGVPHRDPLSFQLAAEFWAALASHK